MSEATLPQDEAVARSYMRRLWEMTSLPQAIHLWRTRAEYPRCRPCDVRTCTRLTTATSPYCPTHERKRSGGGR